MRIVMTTDELITRLREHADAMAFDIRWMIREACTRLELGQQGGGVEMFKVLHKVSKRVCTVYMVSGLMFLVWDAKEGKWTWIPMEECEPVEEG